MKQPNLLTITAGIGEKDGTEVFIFNIKERDGVPMAGIIPVAEVEKMLQYVSVKDIKHYVDADKPEVEVEKPTN